MINKQNKKASIFALGMVLGVIILMGIAWYGFAATNKNIYKGIKIIDPLNYKNLKDNFALYLNESAKLSASQSFYEIAKETAIDKENPGCNIYSGKDYIIWSQECKPEQKIIEEMFIKYYNKSFNILLQEYPLIDTEKIEYNHILEENQINSFASLEKIKTTKKAVFATYNVSYEFDPSTNLDIKKQEIHLEDFISIYQKTTNQIKICKEEENQLDCIKKNLEFERWIFYVDKEGSFFIFEFKTKKYFFFENVDGRERFNPLKLNFAIIEE